MATIKSRGWLALSFVPAIVLVLAGCANTEPKKSTTIGGPIAGLTGDELRKYWQTEALFKKKITPEEGLGPLFNGQSCFECHGQPGVVGGEGRDTTSTNITVFAKRVHGLPKTAKPLPEVIDTLGIYDVDLFLEQGGPTLQRRSVTTEFPDKYPFETQLNFEQLPASAEIVSPRHSPPIFGDGLIDNILDSEIVAEAVKQQSNPALAGRTVSAVDRYTEAPRTARFGWKDNQINLLNFSTQAMNVEMGITTYLNQTENAATFFGNNPLAVRKMVHTPSPNDDGHLLVGLTYFQSLLAPPPRAEITPQVLEGEKVFRKMDCAFCHRETWRTKKDAVVPDPESPLPDLRYMHVKALSDQEFHPYSDFLLHYMGKGLADGIPQEGAKGGEWRTTPLWGLRAKKFLLHDGRTSSIDKAILAHGGQGKESADNYAALSEQDKQNLLAFLKSL